MTAKPGGDANVKEVVPFFAVSSMDRSLRYYVEGLGFKIANKWVVDERVRCCWLTLGSAALMLQEFPREGHDSWTPAAKVGEGVSLCFQCEDAIAIYDELRSRGIEASEPQVGNGMWVTDLSDPDEYRLYFESATNTPEDTKLSAVRPSATPDDKLPFTHEPPFEGGQVAAGVTDALRP